MLCTKCKKRRAVIMIKKIEGTMFLELIEDICLKANHVDR